MSEPGPDSIPTSSSRISNRPTKKRALTPASQQSQQVEALFANPDREIILPNGTKTRLAAAPPEIVANVQGSSAGAGSGEFHVYKASRRREYERLRLMDEEVAKEKADADFKEKQESLKAKDEEKLSKNRAKREKAKARKAKGKSGDGEGETDGNGIAKANGEGAKKKLGAAKIAPRSGGKDKGAEEEVEGGEGQSSAVDEVGITIHEDD